MRMLTRSIAAAGLFAALTASSAAAQVIDPTIVGRNLTNNSWAPNNNLSPYWDTYSADGTWLNGQPGQVQDCNVGFFALGTIDPNCQNKVPGTYLPYTYSFANPNPDAFGFRPGGYYLTLLGGYHGSNSNLFTYACDVLGTGGSNCAVLDMLPSFSAHQVGTPLYFDYSWLQSGYHWGFGYTNSFNPSNGCGVDTFCSGWNDSTAQPSAGRTPQFFALFESTTVGAYGHYSYLVGIEDNKLEYMFNSSYHDGDYQDWLIDVTPTPEPAAMALVATGLVGLGGASLLRRRNSKKSA